MIPAHCSTLKLKQAKSPLPHSGSDAEGIFGGLGVGVGIGIGAVSASSMPGSSYKNLTRTLYRRPETSLPGHGQKKLSKRWGGESAGTRLKPLRSDL